MATYLISLCRDVSERKRLNSPWCNRPFSARSAAESFGAKFIDQRIGSIRTLNLFLTISKRAQVSLVSDSSLKVCVESSRANCT